MKLIPLKYYSLKTLVNQSVGGLSKSKGLDKRLIGLCSIIHQIMDEKENSGMYINTISMVFTGGLGVYEKHRIKQKSKNCTRR